MSERIREDASCALVYNAARGLCGGWEHHVPKDLHSRQEPDSNFYANVCAFPLLTYSGNRLIARVPTRYSPDGGMQFPAMLSEGSKVRLSFTKPEHLLNNTLASANKMAEFAPQAIMLFACVNRRVYMGNERANREFVYYQQICPNLSFAYGFGEILRTPKGGELLNSTIVAVGFREGDVPQDYVVKMIVDAEQMREHTTYKLLSDRLATFLEATTNELEATIAELESLAQYDQLTGIYNRRRMDEIITQRLTKGRRRSDQGLALLMYDIDHFKRINDTFGHEVGDMALIELTQCVQSAIRADDALGRWGGEEFLVLASNMTLEQATDLAERIRKRVAMTPFTEIGSMTISIGVTCAREDDSAASLFARVDDALYDAKNSGRNCVVAFG